MYETNCVSQNMVPISERKHPVQDNLEKLHKQLCIASEILTNVEERTKPVRLESCRPPEANPAEEHVVICEIDERILVLIGTAENLSVRLQDIVDSLQV